MGGSNSNMAPILHDHYRVQFPVGCAALPPPCHIWGVKMGEGKVVDEVRDAKFLVILGSWKYVICAQ